MNDKESAVQHEQVAPDFWPAPVSETNERDDLESRVERRYEVIIKALTDVLADLRRELNGIQQALQRTPEGSLNGAAEALQPHQPHQARTPDGRERATRGHGKDKKPWKSVEDQLGTERYRLWCRAAQRLRDVREKHRLSYAQIHRLMRGDPVWTSLEAGTKRSPSVSALSALGRNEAYFDEERGLYVVSLGGRSTLLKVLTALDNLDLRLDSMSGRLGD